MKQLTYAIDRLQWFMDRIARHPYLQASQYTRLFLESTDFVCKSIKPEQAFIYSF